VELNRNGDLTVDGVVKVKINSTTINLIRSLDIKTSKLQQKYDGYIVIGRTGIHRYLKESTREQDRLEWLRKGWDGQGRFVVLHLDDNPANFNVENLQNAPQSLNLMLKKSTGYRQKSGAWYGSFKVPLGKQTKTKTVASQAEALHAVGNSISCNCRYSQDADGTFLGSTVCI
jgi:hypothetical protein